MAHSAVVVGGGIAGLAAAISLAGQGWQVTVLERRGELGEVGAGVAMSRNAVAAFLGLGFEPEQARALGFPTVAEGTWTAKGTPILAIPEDPVVREAVAVTGVHRRRLHQALHHRAEAQGVSILTGVQVAQVSPGDPEGALAQVAGHEADLVVAADGMRSTIREKLFPSSTLAYSGFSSWRAVIPGISNGRTLRQYWGAEAEFGFRPVDAEQTYWYGYVSMPELTVIEDELAAARERFAGWADPVQRLLAATDPGALLRHDVYHLPGGVPRYALGRVVMIGDAAHGFLPTMGQGVATALEDGLCVGLLVGHPVAAGGSLSAALEGFDQARRPRCSALSRAAGLSARFGAHLGGGWRQPMRNALMRLTPPALLTRGADAAMGWIPPEPAQPVR